MTQELIQCPDCGSRPFKSERALEGHRRRKHVKQKPKNSRRKSGMMPCNPRYCWNCGVPQPREVSL